MIVEILSSELGDLFLGISEINNEQKMKTDELVNLANAEGKQVEAVQFMNTQLILDATHLMSAAQNALNAWNGDYAISRGLGLEILVYVSGQKQIGRAMETHGLRDDLERIILLVVGKTESDVQQVIHRLIRKVGYEIDPPFVVDDEKFTQIMEHYDITEKELDTICTSNVRLERIDALTRCVISRVSMVALET
ncbi:MAG: KEOPS complex subunit Cgi121 [Candidatus Thorarchaeota archaeon]